MRGPLAFVYLLFAVALVFVPQADILETSFDEANTPTNAIVVKNVASSWEHRQPVTTFVPKNIWATAKDQGPQNSSGLCKAD